MHIGSCDRTSNASCQRSLLFLLSFINCSLSSLSPMLVSADHDDDLGKLTPVVNSLAASDSARAS